MAGYADALASVLYPNSAADSIYTLGGKGITQIQLPTFQSPWQNALASTLQGLGGAALQAYGIHATNKANAENAAKMVPQLSQMGVAVPEGVASGLSSENPQTRALALALTEAKVKAAENATAQQAELDKYRKQQDIQFENQKQLKQMELDAQTLKDSKNDSQQTLNNTQALRTSLNSLKETQDYKVASQTYDAMEKAAGMNGEAANVFFKKAFERVSNPGSVVSPTEAAALDNVQSFYDENKGALDKFFNGGGTLDKTVKEQMLTIARNYRNGIADTYEQAAQPYLKDAADAGIKHDRILTVPFLSAKKRNPSTPLTPPAVAGLLANGSTVPPVAGPLPDGSTVPTGTLPTDNVALPFNLPPPPAGSEYRVTVDGIVLVTR